MTCHSERSEESKVLRKRSDDNDKQYFKFIYWKSGPNCDEKIDNTSSVTIIKQKPDADNLGTKMVLLCELFYVCPLQRSWFPLSWWILFLSNGYFSRHPAFPCILYCF